MGGTTQTGAGGDPQLDPNTGMLVDGSGFYVGGPADVGSTVADVQTAVENWFWPAVIGAGALVLWLIVRK